MSDSFNMYVTVMNFYNKNYYNKIVVGKCGNFKNDSTSAFKFKTQLKDWIIEIQTVLNVFLKLKLYTKN